MVVKDSLGSELMIGDQIAYAVRQGNYAALKHYIIQAFTPDGKIVAYNLDLIISNGCSTRNKSFLHSPAYNAVLVGRGEND